jgi:hypothetical protein
MSTATITDPLAAVLLEAIDDAIEARSADIGFCAHCRRRADGSACADHAADDEAAGRYENIRDRIKAGEITVAAGSAARGGNQ